MPLAISLKAICRRFWSSSERSVSYQPSRTLTITCRGKSINREDLFKYTNGRFLANESKALDRRYVKFDVDQLCAVAACTGEQESPIRAIEKLEGGFSKALLLRKEDGSELIAKIPFSIAGPPKYTTASEVAVLQYLHTHTQVPVPKVLAWNSDPSNPVGAEYIMMEKAHGIQLFKVWSEMSDWDQLCLVKQLTKLEGEMNKIRFPASGSLYLRESMTENDNWVPLDREVDPSEDYCIGPSCERGWYDAQGKSTPLHSQFNRGPWPNLSSFGVALADREVFLLGRNSTAATSGPPRGSFDEQMAVLESTKEVMSRLDEPTFIQKISEPVLWHTDLHMGNIYVSEENPASIISLIDWQSIVVSPLFIQARFPEFLPVEESYALGTTELPKLPPTYDQMDADDKEYAEFKLKEAKLAKVYELSSGAENNKAYKALRIPSFLRELFVRCAEVSEEGVIPLRACLIDISETWNDLGFIGECPVSFSEHDLQRHKQQFEEYHDYHRIHELARKIIGTDFEGWITPQVDFATKQKQNEELLQEVMRRSNEYNKSPEEVRRIWPYLERPRLQD